MKICPVCNDSFADELNFCDIDGVRLAREGSAHEKNKWWSLLGVGLLVGGLVISAASIFFLPKARLSNPVGSSEPQSVPVTPRTPAPAAESASNVAANASSEPESATADSVVPEVKKRDRALANNNAGGLAPNPKAAALAAEDADKRSQSDSRSAAPAPPSNPEPPAVKSVSDTQPETNKPQPSPELKREPRTQPATARVSDKDSNDKKKNDEKNKKKSGGFLRVFKKIFGKD